MQFTVLFSRSQTVSWQSAQEGGGGGGGGLEGAVIVKECGQKYCISAICLKAKQNFLISRVRALSWSPMRLKILHWRPEFHNWSPAGD